MQTRPLDARSTLTIAMLASALLLSSCAREEQTAEEETRDDSTQGSPPFEYSLSFLPKDLSTALGGTPLQVYVAPAPVPPDKLQAVADRLRLERLSDGTAVPFTIDIFNPGEPVGYAGPGDTKDEPGTSDPFVMPPTEPAWVRLNPDTPLDESEWYLFWLTEVPDETFALPIPFRETVGAYSVRFTPGSRPTIRTAQFCRAVEGDFTARISFSENVTIPGGELHEKLEVWFGESAFDEQCVLSPDHTFPDPTYPTSVLFECGSNVGNLVTLLVREGMVSPVNGKPLATYSGETAFEKTLEIDPLPRVSASNDCRLWTLE